MKNRIDIFIDSLRGGGAERVCVTLCNELNIRNYNVNLIVMNLDNAAYLSQLNKDINIVNLNKNSALTSIKDIYKYIKYEKPELILTFNYQLSSIINFIRIILQYNVKIISRNINTISEERKNEKILNKIKYKILDKFYCKSDLFIMQSNGMKEDFKSVFNISESKLVVINNPVSGRMKLKKDIEKKKNLILYVGRFGQQKRIDRLIESFSLARNENSNLRLKMIGKYDNKTLQNLKELFKKFKVEEFIELQQFTECIEKEYNRASLTVLTSEYEGFPNVLVESISCGTPIVSFDCKSGPSEIIKNNVNGFLVNKFDNELMASNIVKAMSIEWDEKLIIETAERYSVKSIVDIYENILFKHI